MDFFLLSPSLFLPLSLSLSPSLSLSLSLSLFLSLSPSLPLSLSLSPSRRIIVFFTNTVSIEAIVSSPSHREFRRLATSDLLVEMHSVSFTTSIRYPSLFVVAMAPPPPSYPLLPLRCCMYVASPSDRDQYITNTDILVYVAMNLKTVEMVSH